MTKEEFKNFDLEHNVCECFDVTLKEIIEAIKSGDDTMEVLMEKLDVGTACQLCQSRKKDSDGDREIHLDEILLHLEL